MARRIALLAVLVSLGACPEPRAAAPRACVKAYEQCTLDSGVLGVCDLVACAPGQAEPCLTCRSQH